MQGVKYLNNLPYWSRTPAMRQPIINRGSIQNAKERPFLKGAEIFRYKNKGNKSKTLTHKNWREEKPFEESVNLSSYGMLRESDRS